MSVQTFLAELRARDIYVWADGDRLRCNAPSGALTPDLRDRLRHRKSEILEFLRTAEAVARQQPAIVPMQPRGTRTPVFAVPAHNGDIFAYRDLAQHIGEDQPFFGMHPPGLDDDSEPLKRVEDVAAYFAAQIQAFRPNGPYIIAGYCAGGAVALELAQQLLQRGAAVTFLALFGCPYPTWYRFLPSLPFWVKRIAVQTQVLARQSSFKEARQYFSERLRQRLKVMREKRSPAATDPVSVRKFRFEQAWLAAVRRYSPGRFPGRLCMFLPNKAWLRPDDPRQHWRSPEGLRWRSVAPHTEEYYGPDTCDPNRMLIEPDALAFAELFRQCRDNTSTEFVPLARRQGAKLSWL